MSITKKSNFASRKIKAELSGNEDIFMKKIEFDVELHTAELYCFTMRHTYYSFSGIFSILFSLVCLVIAIIKWSTMQPMTIGALLVIASLFTIVQPVMLWAKCRMQMKQNKNINTKLHYIVEEDGITVQQNDQEAVVKWYEVQKAVKTKKAIYLYMSVVRAFIFPVEQCNGQFEALLQMITQQMEKYKDYDYEEETEESPEEDFSEDIIDEEESDE